MVSQRTPQPLSSRLPDEPARSWLRRILDALPEDADVDHTLLSDLIRGVNGSLGDEQRHIEEDPQAYLWFWRTLAARFPSHPMARAAYADTLLLTGDTEAAVEEMLAAFEADPLLIYRMSGEYRDVMERAGPREWAAYRALVIRAALIHDPDDRDYVEDELRSLMTEVGDDPDLRREVLRLLRQ